MPVKVTGERSSSAVVRYTGPLQGPVDRTWKREGTKPDLVVGLEVEEPASARFRLCGRDYCVELAGETATTAP